MNSSLNILSLFLPWNKNNVRVINDLIIFGLKRFYLPINYLLLIYNKLSVKKC